MSKNLSSLTVYSCVLYFEFAALAYKIGRERGFNAQEIRASMIGAANAVQSNLVRGLGQEPILDKLEFEERHLSKVYAASHEEHPDIGRAADALANTMGLDVETILASKDPQ